MGQVAAIGSDVAVRGFALAGALVFTAEDAAQARAAWAALPAGVDVVILTAEAARAIGPSADRLVAVVPEGKPVPE